MNWPTCSRPTIEFVDFTSRRESSPPLHLEGSLAAVVTLAPIIPIFPTVVIGRSNRRRTVRGKL